MRDSYSLSFLHFTAARLVQVARSHCLWATAVVAWSSFRTPQTPALGVGGYRSTLPQTPFPLASGRAVCRCWEGAAALPSTPLRNEKGARAAPLLDLSQAPCGTFPGKKESIKFMRL